MNKLLLFLMLLGLSTAVYAQKKVSGKVVDQDGIPVPDVNILVKGTSKGTVSDFDGLYTLRDVNPDDVIIFSYVGYQDQEIPVGDKTQIDVTLKEQANQLSEVVVTALNIQRDKASLGYSIDQISADEANLTVTKQNNPINALSGRVSGLQVTQANTGVDGSSRILLRGITTISGSNRPLIVIDGVPVSGGGSGGTAWGGRDNGDALSDINPDDIESISVLKGAGASAAYGSLGMNGVIIVTTKSGKRAGGIGISLSSTFSMTDIMLTPDVQNEYGTGAFGQFAPLGPDGKPVLDYPYSWAWGPKLEGQDYTNWLGKQDVFLPRGDRFKQFYTEGTNAVNTIAFQGADENSSFRFSITDQRTQGIVPNNNMSKQTYNLRASSTFDERFTLDGRVSYVRSKVKNRPELAEGPSNTSLQLSLMPPDVRLDDLRDNIVDENGNEISYNNDNTFNNPYWSLEKEYNEDVKDRMQGVITAIFDVNENLVFTGKSGIDYINTNAVYHADRGSQAIRDGLGLYTNRINKSYIWNSDILGTYKMDFWGVNLNASIGANYRKEFGNSIGLEGVDMKVPDFYHITNYRRAYSGEHKYEKAVYSFYALGELSYGGFFYLDATIRNDNSSALPEDNNSYWYHSENASLLFTKLFGITSKVFNRGKIRASYATVGNDTGPYRTQAVYDIYQTPTLPYTVAGIPNSLPAFDLRPERSKSWEVGTELGFFDNRISMDFTYYETVTTDQIMAVPISGTTGFLTKVVNAGSIENKGIEAQLNLIPVDTDNFTWDLGMNFTQSRSTVVELNEGLESIVLGGIPNAGVTVEARPGEEFGMLYGYDFKRDNFGRVLVNDYGMITRGELKGFGSMNPDFYGGISNNFRYKNLSLRVLVSGQKGGLFYSYGRGYRMFFGTDQRSLEGREGGIVIDGINENTGQPNAVAIPAIAKQFNEIFVNQVVTNMMIDATNVRLKEVVLTYKFPDRLIKPSPLQSLSISAVGTNLLFIYNAAGDIDPEAGFDSSPVGTALELGSLPSTRSIGLNLNINF